MLETETTSVQTQTMLGISHAQEAQVTVVVLKGLGFRVQGVGFSVQV